MFQSKDIEWHNGLKKTRPFYMLTTRDSLQRKGHTQNESEGMEKRYSIQMEMKRKLE